MFYKIFHIFLLDKGSKPEVGSSKMRISGCPRRAKAIDSFLLFPPLNSLDFLSTSSSTPRLAII